MDTQRRGPRAHTRGAEPGATGRSGARDVPTATVARLPGYLRVLHGLTADGVVTTSSEELAAGAGVTPAQLRKDLSFLGSYGRRGVGYDVLHLSEQISVVLGLTTQRRVVIVGILTFAPRALRVPKHVDLRAVDVASELQILAFHDRRRTGTGA